MQSEITSLVILLLILLDPLGNTPMLLARLKALAPARRQRVILREGLIAGVVLILFVFVGDAILGMLHLTEMALQIAGGLILFLIAIGMVFPHNQPFTDQDDATQEPLIVPIAIPMIAGPASLATVLLNARHTENTWVLIAAIVIATLINTSVLLMSERIARWLGRAGMKALERLMGLALTAIAVQMLLNGLKAAWTLPLSPAG